MMKRSEKGHFAPPPRLAPPHAQSLSETLARWPGTEARTHWFLGDESTVDGADFYVGEDELGHLHLDGEAHVAVGTALRDALVRAKLAHPFVYSRAFVTWPVDSAADRARAEWLFSLRYGVLTGGSVDEALRQVQAGPAR
ncbi:MAG: DUF5519 family protein [Myxococcaceae bacterium]|nr:DUF5519 family protein [Myxococcaceae bacterium]